MHSYFVRQLGFFAITLGSQTFVYACRYLFDVSESTPWNKDVWMIIGIYCLLQLVLMQCVPGEKFLGPEAPGEAKPVYYDNGLACFAITMALVGGGLFSGVIDGLWIYRNLFNFYASLNVLGLVVAVLLYAKARLLAGRSSEEGLLADFYNGLERYPHIGTWNIKFWTNCRVGCMGWAVLMLIYLDAYYQLNKQISWAILSSAGLQLVYLAKFFLWESGYAYSMDIQHDNAGYAICWGCITFVPSMYTIHTAWLVEHEGSGQTVALLQLVIGLLSVKANYDADNQRQQARKHGEKYKIWGKPAKLIAAKYVNVNTGKEQESTLLVSGYWGYARHFHYVPEIMAACCWCYSGSLVGCLYPCFLFTLLTHRANRDDEKCSAKYGKYWKQYCDAVPYKILPGVY